MTLRLLADAGTTAADTAVGLAETGAAGVRPNDPVSVRFRKGAVTVEMPGRATGAAEAGGAVTVFVPDARRSFSGILAESKVVSVEIP
jgi:hypothetical protein